MTDLSSGANAPLSNLQIDVAMTWPTGSGSLDASAFLVGLNGKVRSDSDMVFYNQPDAQGGCVRLVESRPGFARFALALTTVPDEIAKVIFCLTVDTGGCSMSAFDGTLLTVNDDGAALHRFQPALETATEVSMMVAEIYRRQGNWKIRAIGQGFRDGLAALATSLGVDVEGEADAEPNEISKTSAATVQQSPPSEPAHPASLPLSAAFAPELPMRTLTRTQGSLPLAQGDTLVPTRKGSQLTITLDWRWTIGGSDGRIRPLKLALGAFCFKADGSRLAVQQPDGRGRLDASPWLAITQGNSASRDSGQERLNLDLDQIAVFAQIDIYTFIAAGTATWTGTEAWINLAGPWPAPAEFRVEPPSDGMATIALLRLVNRNGEYVVSRLNYTAVNQAELDQLLGWELVWRNPRHL